MKTKKTKKQLVPILVDLDVLPQLDMYNIKFEVLVYPSDKILEVIKPEYRAVFFKWLYLLKENNILDESTFHPDNGKSNVRILNLWIIFLYQRGFFVETHDGNKFRECMAFKAICEHCGKEHYSRSYYSRIKREATPEVFNQLPGMTTIIIELRKHNL